MDTDGFVIDCSLAAANTLGYKSVQDIVGKDLIESFVDQDSVSDAHRMLMGVVGLNDDGNACDAVRSVSRIYILRKTKRVLQTSWEVFLQEEDKEVDKDKRVAIVVMHKEMIVKSKPRVQPQDQEAEDEMEKDLIEQIDLEPMKPLEPLELIEDHDVHLTPVQRARKHEDPCKYHFACMQKDGDIDQAATYKDFANYVAAIKMTERPWEIHRLNKFVKKAIQKQFTSIMLAGDNSWREQVNNDLREPLGEVKMKFDTWKMWWDQSDNRKKWDGGLAMTHRNPPGVKDPYDYDKQTR